MGPLKRAFSRLRRSPLAWALAASVLVHLALGWYLATRPRPPPPPPPEASGELVFQVVETPASAPTPAAPEPVKPPPPAAGARHRAHRAKEHAGAKAVAQAEPGTHQSARPTPSSNPEQKPLQAPSGGSASGLVQAPTTDAPRGGPRLKSLLPSDDLLGVPVPGSLLTGRTIRNDGSAPDAGSGEDVGELAQRQVTQLTQDLMATQRVESGAVDYYFHDLRRALEQNVTFQLPMAMDVEKGLKSAVESYRQTLEAYGKTGNPGAVVSKSDEDTVPQNGDPHGTGQARLALMDQTERLKKLLQDSWGTDPVLILELRQTHDGKLLGLRVLQSSGNKVFDEKVIELVPTGIVRAPAVPDHVQARHPLEIRSVWQFKGHYVLHKKLKDMKVENPKDAAYLAAMGAASLLSGMPFEETTGDLYMVDIAHPEFHVTPRLLQLY